MSGPHLKHACAAAALFAALGASSADAAGPKIVSGPSADAGCFVPWTDKTKFFQYGKKPGPYRVALANGFIGNTWRIQMIKTAKAYAEQPEVKKPNSRNSRSSRPERISRRRSRPSTISSIRATTPLWWTPRIRRPSSSVVRRAQAGRRRAGGVRQYDRYRGGHQRQRRPGGPRQILGRVAGRRTCPMAASILEVRGVTGTSVDTDRHKGPPGHPEGVGQAVQTPSRWWASGTTAPPKKSRRMPWPYTSISMA